MPRYSLCTLTLLTCLFFLSACDVFAPKELTADTHWKRHTLENGLDSHFYYKKDEPIEIRLLIHAGSLHETAQQSGYAHFLEHMAFNGSENFSGNSIIAEFEKFGLTFGPDINGYTTYDLTSYQLSLVDSTHMDKALTWFRDIADKLTLDPAEIEAEKGVVLGEIRVSRPKEEPLANQLYKLLIKDTVLAEHDVLGSDSSIKQLNQQQLRKFYQDWYVPNNAELIIVGDFNFVETQQLIAAKFSDWEPKSVAHKKSIEIPVVQDLSPKFMVLPEASSSTISLTFPIGRSYYRTLDEQRQEMQNNLLNTLITQRLHAQALAKKIEHSGVDVASWNIKKNQYNYINFKFAEKMRSVNQQFLATELASLREYGINQSELNTALAPYELMLEQLDADWEQLTSLDIIENKVYALHYDEVYQSREDYKKNLTRFIQSIDIKALNQQLRTQLSSIKPLIVYAMASENAAQVDTEHWLTETDNQFTSLLSQKGSQVATKESLDNFPTPTRSQEVITGSLDEESQLYTWKLENGIEVWFKQLPNADENVYIEYVAKGGSGMLPQALMPAMELSYDTFMRSGLADMDAGQFNDFLTQHDTSLYAEISEEMRGLSVTTTKKELATGFAVLHEAATKAKVDQSQFPVAQSRFIDERKAYIDSPFGRLAKATNTAIYGENSIVQASSAAQLSAVKPKQVDQVYQLLFRQQDDFKLIIVADLTPENIESYLSQYIANITYLPGELTENTIELNQGEDTLIIKASNEPSATYVTMFSILDADINTQDLFIYDLLQKAIARRLTSQLREEKGLDYSPSVGIVSSKAFSITTLYFTMTINSEDKERASNALNDLINGLDKGLDEQELDVAKSQLLSELNKNKDNAEVLISILKFYLSLGYDINAHFYPQPVLDRVTTQNINQAWQDLTSKQGHRLNAYLMQREALE